MADEFLKQKQATRFKDEQLDLKREANKKLKKVFFQKQQKQIGKSLHRQVLPELYFLPHLHMCFQLSSVQLTNRSF